MFRLTAFIVLLVTAIVSNAQNHPISLPELSVSISVDETATSDGLPIRFTLTNTSSRSVHILKWGTPLENGFNSNMFEVWQGETRTPYVGKIIKRDKPLAEDFLTLGAGETITKQLDITDGYAAYDADDYRIAFNSAVTLAENSDAAFKTDSSDTTSNDELFELKLTSKPITTYMSLDRFAIATKQAPAFSSCSRSERNTLDDALSEAEIMAKESSDILNSTPSNQRSNASRYTTWFGRYSSRRYDTVSDHFNKIRDVMSNRRVTFECTCDVDNPNSTFAYVFPNKPYHIHLCGSFWRASMTGQDSKAGTIIHETTHFTAVASTDDHAYGRSEVRNLAQADPDQATDNADSHEYFAENTPALSMGSSQPTPVVDTTPLNINQTISANIKEGQWIYYQVTGASKIILSNMSADFDLYVKKESRPTYSDYDCNPFYSGTQTETCDVSSAGTLFVAVNALLDGGTFSLRAEGKSSTISPKRGLWWNPDRDGTGFDIEINDDKLAIVWYTYNENRSPVWYLADGSYSASSKQGEATIKKYSLNKGRIRSTTIGNMQLKFTDATHANLNWSAGGESGTQNIQYFSASNLTNKTNHSGIWYEPAKPGYGLTVVEQGPLIITVLYFYDGSGQPTWAIGDNRDNYQLDGYRGACPYCRSTPTLNKRVGQLDLNLSNVREGTLSTNIKLNSPLSGRWNVPGVTIKNLTQP